MGRKTNLDKLKKAYAAWHEKKGDCLDVWRKLMAKNFKLASISEKTPGLAFAADRNSREESLKYLAGIFDEWEMLYYKPDTFVSEDDHVAVFGKCAYRYKKTGKEAHVRIACLWRFKGDKLVEMTEIFDTALAARATRPKAKKVRKRAEPAAAVAVAPA